MGENMGISLTLLIQNMTLCFFFLYMYICVYTSCIFFASQRRKLPSLFIGLAN